MIRRRRNRNLHVVVLLCLLPTAEASQLFVGTAKLELTPPVKAPLAGYSRRRGKPATGIHDPLFVRALVIREGTVSVALVSCDLLMIDELLFDAVKRRLEALGPPMPLPLLIAATHTHSGPGAYGQKFLEKLSMGHFNPAVFDFLAAQIAQAILTASTRMQPVTVSYAATRTTGLVANRMHADGVIDPELAVAAFSDQHRKPVALIVNFSAHATTLGAWNRSVSADYPGVLTQAIEERYPDAVCLFVAGAVGDQAPVKRGNEFEPAQRLGGELASRIFTLLERPPEHHASSLLVDQRAMRLPPARLRLGKLALPSWISRAFVDDDATLTLVAVDRMMLIGVPCDLSAELGLELKAHARTLGYQPMVVGFANDYIGYCLPERLYRTDSYEASMAFNGPQTGPRLVEELRRMMNQLGER